MAQKARGPKLFTCPKCGKAYLGHDPLPDCPACGFDYRVRDGLRWDVFVYFLSILALLSYLLVSSSYRSLIMGPTSGVRSASSTEEKLPGSGQIPIAHPPNHNASR